jgi:hypothetical protein
MTRTGRMRMPFQTTPPTRQIVPQRPNPVHPVS